MVFYFFESSSQFFIYLFVGHLEDYIGYGHAKKKYRENNGRCEQKFFRAAPRVIKFTFAAKSARKAGALALQQDGDTQQNTQDYLDNIYHSFVI